MPTRRILLSAMCNITILLSGCSGNNQEDFSTRLSVSGSVMSQASSATPLKIEFRCTNESSDPITISSHDANPFEVFPLLPGPSGDAVLLPESGEVTADVPSSRYEGCWQFVKPDGSEAQWKIEMDIDHLELEPDSTFTVQHSVYYRGDSDDCFPAGTYTKNHEVRLESSQKETKPTVVYTPKLVINDDKTATVTVEGPL